MGVGFLPCGVAAAPSEDAVEKAHAGSLWRCGILDFRAAVSFDL
jgi:hypothetical protein